MPPTPREQDTSSPCPACVPDKLCVRPLPTSRTCPSAIRCGYCHYACPALERAGARCTLQHPHDQDHDGLHLIRASQLVMMHRGGGYAISSLPCAGACNMYVYLHGIAWCRARARAAVLQNGLSSRPTPRWPSPLLPRPEGPTSTEGTRAKRAARKRTVTCLRRA